MELKTKPSTSLSDDNLKNRVDKLCYCRENDDSSFPCIKCTDKNKIKDSSKGILKIFKLLKKLKKKISKN